MSPSAGTRFDDLVRIMRALRAPGGCPWDREQTLQSLRPFVLEETYELLDALDRSDYPVIQAVTIYLAVITMVVNLATDVLYKLVDPRVVLR